MSIINWFLSLARSLFFKETNNPFKTVLKTFKEEKSEYWVIIGALNRKRYELEDDKRIIAELKTIEEDMKKLVNEVENHDENIDKMNLELEELKKQLNELLNQEWNIEFLTKKEDLQLKIHQKVVDIELEKVLRAEKIQEFHFKNKEQINFNSKKMKTEVDKNLFKFKEVWIIEEKLNN